MNRPMGRRMNILSENPPPLHGPSVSFTPVFHHRLISVASGQKAEAGYDIFEML